MSTFKLFSCCFASPSLEENSAAEIQNALILEMPDIVIRKILKNLDFMTIPKLRKVCHALRDFIDEVNPDCKLKNISIRVGADDILGTADGIFSRQC